MLNHLGQVAQLREEYMWAESLHRESQASLPESYHYGQIHACLGLGASALGRGNVDAAARWFGEGLTQSQTMYDQADFGIAWCLAGLGSAAALGSRPEHAARLWGAAERLRQSLGCRPAPASRTIYERAMAAARAAFGDDAFAAAWVAGRAMPLEQAIAMVLTLAG